MATVLNQKFQSKRRSSLPFDPHAFESIGSILRGMRAKAEALMAPTFDRPLSLRIDALLDQEQRLELEEKRTDASR